MKTYRILIGEPGSTRLSFEAIAPDSCTAAVQHSGLCEPGERVTVYTAAEWEAKRFQPRSLSAIALDQRKHDVEMAINRRSNVHGGGW